MSNVRQVVSPVLAVALTVAALACSPSPSSGDGFDRATLEQVEDAAESLANDLLAFSVAVRDADRVTIGSFVADRVEVAPIDRHDPEPHLLAGYIDERHWAPSSESRTTDRDGFLAELSVLTDRFAAIDDARFKVVASHLGAGATTGTPQLKFFLVGRNRDGKREWLKGKIAAGVRHDGERWRITRFVPTEIHGKVARVELFSEVAFPAGVAARFPAFGEGKNEGFVFHGVAVADVNLDGILDVATTGVEQNRLYLGRGDGTFDDASESSFVGLAPVGSGAVFLDHDNDGDPDLFLAAVGPQILFENRFVPDGEVRFWDVSERAGVDRDAVGFSPVVADVNGDGLPDVYVASYNRYGTVMPDSWIQAENGTPNRLFVNQGGGTFGEAAGAWGVADGRWSYAAGFVDIDEDGDQDLYVANDFGENALYRNLGDRFESAADEFGLVDPGFGMGVSFGDYDNDGDLDLHVTNMSSTAGNRILKLLYPEGHPIRETLSKQAAGNSLYANQGDGTFRDVTADLGGLSGGWGFGGGFIDFDNDGREDLYNPNGFVSGKSMKDT